jgi:ferredoxin
MAAKVLIDHNRCQGHGRCYDLAPEVFTDDDEGYTRLVGDAVAAAYDGTVAPEHIEQARLAVLNCPESAIELVEEAM